MENESATLWSISSYNQVVLENQLVANMWLHFGLENNEMIDQVSKIVQTLCGSFYVDGARFIGKNKQFFCESCGNYFVNP